MIRRVGVLGVGHLAGYLIEGLRRADPHLEIVLSPRNRERSAALAERFRARVTTSNQDVADGVDLVLLTTRPGDAVDVCSNVRFRAGQVIVSAAAGVSLADLRPAVAPALAVRAMPISCAAINQSPTLLYPDHPEARRLLELLGRVHLLASESQFTSASALSAFYGWLFALLDEALRWTVRLGVPPQTARELVLETASGAAAMARAQPDQNLSTMVDHLATPGGITEHGLEVLQQRGSLSAWTDALDAVLLRLERGL